MPPWIGGAWSPIGVSRPFRAAACCRTDASPNEDVRKNCTPRCQPRAAGTEAGVKRKADAAPGGEDRTLASSGGKPSADARRLPALAVGALGVVFGDIGTSPLYAFKQCFHDAHAPHSDAAHVLGVCSLIVWALVGVVCVKYVGFVLRADHQGQGGTLALLALLRPVDRTGVPPRATWVVLLVLFGSALLYGDGAITPAISVVSAVEGVGIVTKGAQPYLVPIAAGLLLALFAVQPRGTGAIGKAFGPIMLLWFLAI